MAAVGAEGVVVLVHRRGEPGCDRFLAEREVTRALDQILQEEIICALFGVADFDLQLEQAQPRRLGDLLAALRRWRLSRKTHLKLAPSASVWICDRQLFGRIERDDLRALRGEDHFLLDA